MAEIKLLALDIDRTTLTSDATLPYAVKEAIGRVRDAHIPIVLTSGRGVNGVYKYKKLLELPDAYCCADNGATVFSDITEITVTKHIPRGDYIKIIAALKEKQIETTVTTPQGLFYEHISDYMKKFMLLFNDDMPHHIVNDLQCVSDAFKICVCPHTEAQAAFTRSVSTENTEFCRGYKEFSDYTPKGVTKGTALDLILNKLEINKTDIAAVGDAQNDVALIKGAGLACAVANAEEDVKAVANVLLPSCDELGVKYLIDHYILSARQ